MTVYSELMAAKEMDPEARLAYANWLWVAVNWGSPQEQRCLAKFELDIEEPAEDIRARWLVARRSTSLDELTTLLNMLALWPRQRWRRFDPFGARPSFNHRLTRGHR